MITVTPEVKQKVVASMLAGRSNFGGSDAKYAVSLGIHKSQLAQLKAGKTDRLLSDAKWIGMARRLGVQLGTEPAWQIAKTPVFQMISSQLTTCQSEGVNGIFCDKADVGKTATAKHYVRNNPNAVYVDCSQVKTRPKLVRYIAKEFGLENAGRYADVYEDLVYYLKAVDRPLVILDEAGDLDYNAFLELKALWNATEGHCGWYMMGADGLAAKIYKGIGVKKIGFTEIFSRYGGKFNHATPEGTEAADAFRRQQATMVIRANYPTADVEELLRKTLSSLRRVRIAISKLKKQQA